MKYIQAITLVTTVFLFSCSSDSNDPIVEASTGVASESNMSESSLSESNMSESTNNASTDEAPGSTEVATPDPSTDPGLGGETDLAIGSPGPDGVQGQELMIGKRVEAFEPRAGISASIVAYALEDGQPRVNILFNNSSGSVIHNAFCEVQVLASEVTVGTSTVFFASFNAIDNNESALSYVTFPDLANGYDDFDLLIMNCDWKEGDGNPADVANGDARVSLVEYSMSGGTPSVTLLLENSSEKTLEFATCAVNAKRGNLILDVAEVIFNSSQSIQPGEAVEDSGMFFELTELSNFDFTTFSLNDVYCKYDVI